MKLQHPLSILTTESSVHTINLPYPLTKKHPKNDLPRPLPTHRPLRRPQPLGKPERPRRLPHHRPTNNPRREPHQCLHRQDRSNHRRLLRHWRRDRPRARLDKAREALGAALLESGRVKLVFMDQTDLGSVRTCAEEVRGLSERSAECYH